MNRILSLILLAAALAFSQLSGRCEGGPIGTQQFVKTNTSTTVPVALASAGTYANRVTIVASRAARNANSGDVYVGPTSTNDAQPIKIAAGDRVTLTAPPGEWIDLSEWYLDVTTANDGIVVLYTQ